MNRSFFERRAREETDNQDDTEAKVHYYGLLWDSEKFKRVEIDTCWQQHERGRPVSDWMVAY